MTRMGRLQMCPLLAACTTGRTEIAQQLVAHKADPNHKYMMRGGVEQSLLRYLCSRTLHADTFLETFKVLLAVGADAMSGNDDGSLDCFKVFAPRRDAKRNVADYILFARELLAKHPRYLTEAVSDGKCALALAVEAFSGDDCVAVTHFLLEAKVNHLAPFHRAQYALKAT